MKKTALILAFIVTLTGASAQMTNYIHNFQFNAGGGFNTLLYNPTDGQRHTGMGIVGEAQYQLMLNEHWGLAIGVQASTLRSSATYNYGYTIDNVLLPGAMECANADLHFYNWRERQNAWLLSMPLQLLFRSSLNVNTAFQMALGARLDHPMSAKYKVVGGRYVAKAYMPSTNVTYSDMPNHGLGTFEGDQSGEIEFLKSLWSLAAEMGFVFNLSQTTGLYLGVYGSYSPRSIYDPYYYDGPLLMGCADYSGCFGEPNITSYGSTFRSDRVEEAFPFEIGLKLGLRFGTGKEIGWRAAEAAAAAEAARIEAERLAEQQRIEQERAEAEARAKQEAIELARREAEARAQATADSIARVHAAELAKARAEADAKAAQLARAQAAADSLRRVQEANEARLKAEKDSLMRAEEEARIKAENEARERAAAEAQAAALAKAEQRVREEAAFVAGYKDIAYFETGKDTPIFGELNEDSWENLKNVMAKYPEITVTVTGHTDNVGKPASNLTLSQKRADNIKKMLVAKGIDETRIKAIGKGDTEPIESNKTAAGRAKNRRIEITIGR